MAGRHLAVALLVVLTATACTGHPHAASDPPAADFTATIDQYADNLIVNYRFVNRSAVDLIVLNRLPPWPNQPDPYQFYVVGVGPPGRVALAKRAFARPALGEAYVEPLISGVILASGQSTSEHF